ncbi:disulfide isomerase-like protein 1-6 [Tanacetum coccineum]
MSLKARSSHVATFVSAHPNLAAKFYTLGFDGKTSIYSSGRFFDEKGIISATLRVKKFDNGAMVLVNYRSAKLMPRFAEAATEIKSEVLMSKVDAERCLKATSGLGIKGYPTLLLFVNMSSQAYTGGVST